MGATADCCAARRPIRQKIAEERSVRMASIVAANPCGATSPMASIRACCNAFTAPRTDRIDPPNHLFPPEHRCLVFSRKNPRTRRRTRAPPRRRHPCQCCQLRHPCRRRLHLRCRPRRSCSRHRRPMRHPMRHRHGRCPAGFLQLLRRRVYRRRRSCLQYLPYLPFLPYLQRPARLPQPQHPRVRQRHWSIRWHGRPWHRRNPHRYRCRRHQR